jgi:hypothetical protein
LLGGKEKVEEAARRGEDRGGARLVKQGKGKGRKEGEGGADRWGPGVSGCGGKRIEGADAGRCRRCYCGPVGRWAERQESFLFFFFFFFVKLFSKSNLFNSNSNQNFSNLSQNFINLLDVTEATKNHA